MKNEQKTRIEVEVELRHRGSAPLHLNKEKKRGKAVVAYGPRGVEMIERRWLASRTWLSLWRNPTREDTTLLLNDTEALDLVNPAAMMESFLSEAILLSDETVSWQGRPARLLVIRPTLFEPNRREGEAPAQDAPMPFASEAKVWLDENGVPLAMERDFELRLGQVVSATVHQALTFQQVDGHLLVAEARETQSGTALAVLRSRDERKIKVVAVN